MKKNLYLFIHGVGSTNDTWEKYISILKDDDDINIVEANNIQADNTDTSNYYDFFGYESPILNNFFSNIFLFKKLSGKKEAGDLSIATHSEVLLSYIENKQDNYDNIYLLAHSMGGLIALHCIFKLIRKNSRLINKINKVVLFAVPITGSDDANDIKKYFSSFIAKKYFSNIVKELAKDSQTIVDTRKKLNKYKKKLKQINILAIYGSMDSRIAEDSRSAAKNFCSDVKVIQCSHSDIIKPKNCDSESYVYAIKFINKFNLNIPSNSYEKSILKLENKWYENKTKNKKQKSFIVTESFYVNTIYANYIFIAYLKYKIKMMENGTVNIKYCFRPFDGIVKKNIKEDDFFKNYARERFVSKSYKIDISPTSIPVEWSKPKYYIDDKQLEWVEWEFSSKKIEKGQEFDIEISISDKINIQKTQKAIKRREEYFSYMINNIDRPHGVRHNTFQIETYNDTENKNVALPFEPWISVDGKEEVNKDNCKKNIFYKKWEWDFYYCDLDSKTIKINLRESDRLAKQGANCD